MRFPSNIGFILLAIFLILYGIVGLTGLALPALVLSIFALLAGIFLLIGR